MPLGARFLRWTDVDPARHAFDPAHARAVALDVVGAVVKGHLDRNRPGGASKDQIERDLERGLVAAYGAWIVGWTWAASEPGGGGPIHAWCCADDSVFARGDKGARPTIERVVAAVVEWRAFLEHLATIYAELRDATAESSLARRTEHAASRLVAFVVERTGAEDAWYETFTQVLRWFLEACGHDIGADQAIARVVRGRFNSWVAPDADAISGVVRSLGEVVELVQPVEDSLRIWLGLRERMFSAHEEQTCPPVVRDAHRAFIESRDRARDPIRADRMATALEACRASARCGEPLTFELLADWQQVVLGLEAPPAWRTTDALARHVRYAYWPDLPVRFAAALEQANSNDPVEVRAVRAYLDVCFFHPFTDGNARAARLAFDHVLTRAGLVVAAADPIFIIARATDDSSGVLAMTEMVRRLVGTPG